ncbi:hypothetical protein BDQ17DRAFT_1229006 [Cyathus striatus]|nr:hypothetical protein BDQ17DRAFT_1229006 [Cyathus striatus]
MLLPRSTPSSICCPPNEVVIHLSTTLVIPDYKRYWEPTPIPSFQPTYLALDDGSLVTSPFTQDLWNANLSLLVTGALAMLFTRNIFVSADYIRRGKVKRKALFYILFLSQILAPVSLVPVILSYFYKWTDCTIVIVLSCVSGTVSLALLITGILGVKAYKCLSNPPFVLVMLVIFQLASIAMVIMDVITTQASRRISGSCVRTSDLQYTRYFVSIQFLESLFICCCFLYACWKSRGSPAVRGRISLELSMEELPIDIPPDAGDASQPTRRGWWGHVPTPEIERPIPVKLNISQVVRRVFSVFPEKLGKTIPLKAPKSPEEKTREGDLPSSITQFHNPVNARRRGSTSHGRHSPTPSSGSRFSRLVPRMELFREVMKDELFYTTFITASCVIVAVLAVIGVNFKNGLTVTGWIALNCKFLSKFGFSAKKIILRSFTGGLISMLAMHSFGRVVRRNEREALLSHPITCTAISRAANANMAAREARLRRRSSITTISSRVRLRQDPQVQYNSGNFTDDPFSDAYRLEPNVNENGSIASSRPVSPLTPMQLQDPGIFLTSTQFLPVHQKHDS